MSRSKILYLYTVHPLYIPFPNLANECFESLLLVMAKVENVSYRILGRLCLLSYLCEQGHIERDVNYDIFVNTPELKSGESVRPFISTRGLKILNIENRSTISMSFDLLVMLMPDRHADLFTEMFMSMAPDQKPIIQPELARTPSQFVALRKHIKSACKEHVFRFCDKLSTTDRPIYFPVFLDKKCKAQSRNVLAIPIREFAVQMKRGTANEEFFEHVFDHVWGRPNEYQVTTDDFRILHKGRRLLTSVPHAIETRKIAWLDGVGYLLLHWVLFDTVRRIYEFYKQTRGNSFHFKLSCSQLETYNVTDVVATVLYVNMMMDIGQMKRRKHISKSMEWLLLSLSHSMLSQLDVILSEKVEY